MENGRQGLVWVPDLDPLSRAGDSLEEGSEDSEYDCDYGCGFKASFDVVAAHEVACERQMLEPEPEPEPAVGEGSRTELELCNDERDELFPR